MFFTNLYRKRNNKLLFTTPSHSQKFCLINKFRQFYKYDISETETHNPEAALDLAQKHAAKIYGTKQTMFLTNGSTSGIITAVLALINPEEKILIWENAHPCHKNAVELAGGIPVTYSLPVIKKWDVYDKTTAEIIEPELKKGGIKAVIVTSPTYEGIVSDIKTIKELCSTYGAYLIVDEAHGALYPFCDKLPETAMKYADITVQSLHKTAGGLNPTALIHSNLDFDIQPYLKKITTTSPSYPLLAAIEKNINYLNSSKGRNEILKLISQIETLMNECKNIEFFGDDITKILIKKDGMSGYELSELLFNKYNIEDEKTNGKSTMLLCGIGTTEKKFKKLAKVLCKL
ncbi:MAG: aminotransferase class I/II-fold pyridoxal phosphate-dependent enzyme [Candidatus Gastranaerophilales bacterium]|nr:aminotransferase class I/II-fold pyridoxal phosphate-dependent enzyme [Candidatus Gastranaerophilales bacterium]